MSNVEQIEDEVRRMNPKELAEFRNWFLEFDSRQWDEQIDEDVHAGRLDKIANKAIHSKRKATEL
jgi:hypothetical protein